MKANLVAKPATEFNEGTRMQEKHPQKSWEWTIQLADYSTASESASPTPPVSFSEEEPEALNALSQENEQVLFSRLSHVEKLTGSMRFGPYLGKGIMPPEIRPPIYQRLRDNSPPIGKVKRYLSTNAFM
jgi:hypothetical protein